MYFFMDAREGINLINISSDFFISKVCVSVLKTNNVLICASFVEHLNEVTSTGELGNF